MPGVTFMTCEEIVADEIRLEEEAAEAALVERREKELAEEAEHPFELPPTDGTAMFDLRLAAPYISSRNTLELTTFLTNTDDVTLINLRQQLQNFCSTGHHCVPEHCFSPIPRRWAINSFIVKSETLSAMQHALFQEWRTAESFILLFHQSVAADCLHQAEELLHSTSSITTRLTNLPPTDLWYPGLIPDRNKKQASIRQMLILYRMRKLMIDAYTRKATIVIEAVEQATERHYGQSLAEVHTIVGRRIAFQRMVANTRAIMVAIGVGSVLSMLAT